MNGANLYELFWELNYLHFGGALPPIELLFSGRLKTTGGQYFRAGPRGQRIQISLRYLEKPNAWAEVRDTLGHELVHYWLDLQEKPCGHTAEFRKKLRECGFNRFSRLTPTRARYLYTCPSCNQEYFRKRKGIWSCGPCSGSRYNAAFRLELKLESTTVSP